MTREVNSKTLANRLRLPDGLYRTTCYGAEYSRTRNGRPMYTVTLLVDEGEWEHMMIRWKLVEVREYPKLLHQYFRGLAALGVDIMAYAAARGPEDTIRQIVQEGARLDVLLRTETRGWQNVQDFRRVPDQTS